MSVLQKATLNHELARFPNEFSNEQQAARVVVHKFVHVQLEDRLLEWVGHRKLDEKQVLPLPNSAIYLKEYEMKFLRGDVSFD